MARWICKPPLAALMNRANSFSQNTAGLWVANEGGGLVANDLSGNGQKGTLTSVSWGSGMMGGPALSFNGSSGGCDCGTSALLNPGAVSCFAWVNFAAFSNAYNSVIVHNGATRTAALWVKSTGKLAVYVSPSAYDGTGTFTLTTGVWYHLGFTASVANGAKGYVNGVLDGSFAQANFVAQTTTLGLGFDSNTAGRILSGLIDNAVVFNRVLTPAEVQQIYLEPYCMVQPQRRRTYFIPGNITWGFNFRATLAGPASFPGDGATEAPVLGEVYPHAYGNGALAGWSSLATHTDRSGVVDRRLAGVNAVINNVTAKDFTVVLPAPGTYTITLAFGDASFAQSTAVVLKDSSTPLITIGKTGTSSGHFLDSTATDRTSAAWPTAGGAGPVTVTLTFATSTLVISLGANDATSTSSVIAHLSVVQGSVVVFTWQPLVQNVDPSIEAVQVVSY